MWSLPTSKGVALKTILTFPTTIDTKMEKGRHHYGFHIGLTKREKRK
jgi:hypothetical protein